MAKKWGKVDYRELEALRDRLEQFQKVDMDEFCSKMAKNLAARLLRRVKQRTPTGNTPDWVDADIQEEYWTGYQGGTLRNSWKIENTVTKNGVVYEIEVYNPVEYASYVEYGHRQQAGRFVPQIGRRLKSGWVEGRFMLKISEEQIQAQAPKILERELNKKLKEIFDA